MKIVVRLPIPEGQPGTTVDVSEHRAHALVGSNYARYSDEQDAPVLEMAEETYVEEEKSEGVEVELPGANDLKEEWAKAAQSLGISLVDKGGKEYTKAELIDLVRNATG